jgi:hypothetical protein
MAAAMIHQPVCHTWRLREADDENLGLAFTDYNLLIGRTPLIEKHDGQFVVRQQHDIERLLSRAYRTEVRVDRLMSGLATVACALNADDQCLARIAAVHLRIPDIPDRLARDAMEAMDVFIKYGRDDGGGDSNWNPALHPRTGTPPNPGWFAPTEGESSSARTAQNDDQTRRSDASPLSNENFVRLRPGPKRIDELADFIEWIANATPEDAPAIRAEIDRYFKSVGWDSAAHDLKNMLAVLIRPGITREDRQSYLNRLDLYTRVDPAEYIRVFGIVAGIAAGIGRAPPAAHEPTTVGTAQSEATATISTRAAEGVSTNTPSVVWNYGWAKRGQEIHKRFSDDSLPPLFRTIDNFTNGNATSIKSIDLRAATYQDPARLTYRLNKYIDSLRDYEGGELLDTSVKLSDITERTLQLIVPLGSMTEVQSAAVEAAQARALVVNRYPVKIVVIPF